jgi:hypothetical protein
VLVLWLRFGRGTSWNKSELGGMAGLDPELSCGYAIVHPTAQQTSNDVVSVH